MRGQLRVVARLLLLVVVVGVALICTRSSVLAPNVSQAGELCFDIEWLYRCTGYTIFPPVWMRGYSADGDYCVVPGVDHYLTLSPSSTDPHVHTGPIVDGRLYLWARASAFGSYGFGYCGARFPGDIPILGFEPAPGRSGVWEDDILRWDGPCEVGVWVLMGNLIVESAVSTDSPTWGRLKALYR